MSHGADLDTGPQARHHTLGTGANQAAPGNHTHALSNALQSSSAAVATNNSIAAVDGISIPAGQTWLLIGSGVVLGPNATPTGSAGMWFGTTSASITGAVGVEGDTSPCTGGSFVTCYAVVNPGSTTTYFLNVKSGSGAGACTWQGGGGSTFTGLPSRMLLAVRLA